MASGTKNILNERIGDTPPPKTIPTGKWLLEIDDCNVSKKSTGTKAWFNLTPVEPAEVEDPELRVDAAEAEEYAGEDGLENQTVFHSYTFPDRQYECTKFLDAIGVDASDLKWRELKEIAGIKFYAVVSHDPNDRDPARPWVRLKAFEPYEVEEDDEGDEAPEEE